MIRPTNEDVKTFLDFSASDFEHWLRVGLEGYLLENDVWAFDAMAVFINQDEHIIFDLYNIYSALGFKSKSRFRQAVATLIATLETNENNIKIFEALLFLSSKISAASEVLPVLASRVGNGFFGIAKNESGMSIFDITIRTVADLAAPIEAAKNCLHELIGSRYFINAYAGTALLALCRVDPRGLADHLGLLRGKLYEMFKLYNVDSVGKQRWAKRVLDNIGFYNLSRSLSRLELSIYEDNPQSDNWLVVSLLDKYIDFRPKSETQIEIFQTSEPTNNFLINRQKDILRNQKSKLAMVRGPIPHKSIEFESIQQEANFNFQKNFGKRLYNEPLEVGI